MKGVDLCFGGSKQGIDDLRGLNLGIVSHFNNDMTGVQGNLLRSHSKTVKGFQFGFASGCETLTGCQLGFLSINEEKLTGCQLGFINVFDGYAIIDVRDRRNVNGFQFGVLNFVGHGNGNGLQLGLFNAVEHGRVNGYQIGLINYSAEGVSSGAQIGLLNVKKG